MFLQTANRFVQAAGDVPVSTINERHRGRFIAFLTDKGLAPATVNKYLRTIQSFFYWAKACGELEEVPSFKQIREPKKIPKILSEEDFSRLLEHIARKMVEARSPRERRYLLLHQRYVMIAAGTGARRNEIVMTPWSAVDFEAGVIVVRVSTRLAIKEKKEKEIPLAGFLLTYLKGQREANPEERWLMDDGSGRLAYTSGHSVTTAFGRHLRAIGLGGQGIKSTHNFRALFATRLRNQLGVDVLTISGLLGHSTTAMTERYFSGDREKKEEAVKRLDQLAQDWHIPAASLPSH
ncbi:MAG: site-specific integrase, partial [SAR324 cluster bacterium]|nr:site-specific integrase [SAR324 cluster bacterium]